MLPLERLNQQLQAEVDRVGGGYLRTDATGFEASCFLFVHEGSELGIVNDGSVQWHAWSDCRLSKRNLLSVLKRWPSYAGPPLDARVGIWYKHFTLQRHRQTGALRWKDRGLTDTGYPDIFPWPDLQRLASEAEATAAASPRR